MKWNLPEIELTKRVNPPGWAFWERFLLEKMSQAGVEFVRQYTRPDGTLIWREEWPGMDGSDDAYESFFNFPLLYALGGNPILDEIARFEWEAITRQFTEYGQIYREFDGYYDWMHHGESSLLFYFFGLTNPYDRRMYGRALRFARMYLGEDPSARNYDPLLKIIRSPINGSRGPRFETSAEDWVTHRSVLTNYPPPFEDIPGVAGERVDWQDDILFSEILRLMNERMMKGDVPLNLTATSLVTHAFLYSGDSKYRNWVLSYLSAWMDRARSNGGILPDNVGLKGEIGEYMGGKWWGGYYGWRWPHGWMNLIEPALIASSNALLLTGDFSYLELPRWQIEAVEAQGRWEEGVYKIPYRHGDQGWYDYRKPDASYAVYLWYLSMDPQDAQRIERWRAGEDWSQVREGRGKGDNIHTQEWYAFIQGNHPQYPEKILEVNYNEVCRRLQQMRRDKEDPESWDIHHWQEINPVVCEGLVQLTLGGPQVIYHGGLLHCRLRYFDPERQCPGLPPDVAALVYKVDSEGVAVEIVNLNPLEGRTVLVQAGAFGEHSFSEVILINNEEKGARQRDPLNDKASVDTPYLQIHLAPASGGRLWLGMKRYFYTPRYSFPWCFEG